MDEFDANFNPSLTENFYKILTKYFASKGIIVVLAMYLPTSISLAPDSVSFYEVFRQLPDSTDRVLPVQKFDYEELKLANEYFYAKINNQLSRIKELEENQKRIRFIY